MSINANSFVVHRNGETASVTDLTPLAFAGHAHFTAMQVREGKIQGLDLHLARLRYASLKLFGRALPDENVLLYLRRALEASSPNISLVATVYSLAGEFTAVDAALELLIRTGPASSGPNGPLALAIIEHERFLYDIKHVGEVVKTYSLREAIKQGFDDVAFTDRHGRFSEGTIWNLAFWDGSAVIWPRADILDGVTMSIVRRQLERLGIPQRDQEVRLADLPGLAGAVVMNSWTPGVAVHRIGPSILPDAPNLLKLLHQAYQSEPFVVP